MIPIFVEVGDDNFDIFGIKVGILKCEFNKTRIRYTGGIFVP